MYSPSDVRELVRKAYGEVAKGKLDGLMAGGCCCADSSACVSESPDAARADADHPLPESDLGLSCGNPLSFGLMQPGQVVLDLGSGAGKDVFLAASIVGANGRAIGVDMTPDMLELARSNADKFAASTGLRNTEFREGFIEDLPVEADSVDFVISNCVINLSPDKPKVFREAHRVLRPGGKLVVSDIVLNRPLPDNVASDATAYANCLAGALLRQDYLGAIEAAGFSGVEILDDHGYSAESCCSDPVTAQMTDALVGSASSITVLAVK
jgi:SAM-dependent methyltransferase